MDPLTHIVVAQLLPRGKVRALVIGIGAKPWFFNKARAAIRCRRARPDLPHDELTLLIERLTLEAEAVVAPIRERLNVTPVKRRLTAAQAKRRIQRRPGMRSIDPDGPLLSRQ